MPRHKVVTRQPRYFESVEWIALNDNAGDDDPMTCGQDGVLQAAMIERIAGYISTLLVADMFGADPSRVAHDVFRRRYRYMAVERG